MTTDDNNSEGKRLRPDIGGASIEMRDSRMSRLVGVGLAITPVAVVAIGAWIANSIGSLNQTVTKLVTQNEAIIQRLNAHDIKNEQQDEHLNSVDRRVSTLEGRAFRGVPGYEPEAKRGH